jgi:RNA polymerase sigma-B factor
MPQLEDQSPASPESPLGAGAVEDVEAGAHGDDGQVEALLAEAASVEEPAAAARLRQEAVLLSLHLAEGAAHRYRGRGIEFEDLLQVGRMALVKAVRGYQHDRGGSFAAYAIPTISGEIKRYFRDCGWAVRPPRRLQEIRAGLSEREAALQQELQRTPTSEELADALGVELDEVAQARLTSAAYSALSLDAPAPGSDMESPLELASDEVDGFELVERRDALRQALATLTPREQRIIRLRFVEECTQTQIGEDLGVSQMQVSRLLTRTLARLRERLEEGEVAVAAEDEQEPASA